jgi:hypothetical protein
MKKIALVLVLLLSFTRNSSAQVGGAPAMEVQESQFTANPAAYMGKTIKIKNISVLFSDAPNQAPAGSKPCSAPSPGSKMIKLEFANPRFFGCFEIPQNLCNSIPKNIECIGNVIFRVEPTGNYKIIDCKIQP